MRLIDADALMKDLEKWLKQVDPTHPQEDNAIPPMEDIIVSTLMTIEEQPTVETEQQWIPVTERLPEEERKNYWICTDTGHQCECRWTNNCFGIGESDEWGWSIFDIPRFSHVVAWRKLPSPYKWCAGDERRGR